MQSEAATKHMVRLASILQRQCIKCKTRSGPTISSTPISESKLHLMLFMSNKYAEYTADFFSSRLGRSELCQAFLGQCLSG